MGAAQVTVPAGTFSVTRNRIVDAAGKVLATYDFNKDVLPFGVVRSETEKVKMELLASGKDAVSVITEVPMMMKTPPGMPDANPRGTPPGMEAPEKGPAARRRGGYGMLRAPATRPRRLRSPAPGDPAATASADVWRVRSRLRAGLLRDQDGGRRGAGRAPRRTR